MIHNLASFPPSLSSSLHLLHNVDAVIQPVTQSDSVNQSLNQAGQSPRTHANANAAMWKSTDHLPGFSRKSRSTVCLSGGRPALFTGPPEHKSTYVQSSLDGVARRRDERRREERRDGTGWAVDVFGHLGTEAWCESDGIYLLCARTLAAQGGVRRNER
ncbi:hypothetical protein BC567DRAFT_93765 [Phyllosticta citribraziliensis]